MGDKEAVCLKKVTSRAKIGN